MKLQLSLVLVILYSLDLTQNGRIMELSKMYLYKISFQVKETNYGEFFYEGHLENFYLFCRHDQ